MKMQRRVGMGKTEGGVERENQENDWEQRDYSPRFQALLRNPFSPSLMEAIWPACHHTAGIHRCGQARAAARACPGEAAGSPALGFGKVSPRPARTTSFPSGSRGQQGLGPPQPPADSSRPAHVFTWRARRRPPTGGGYFFPQRE